MVMESFHSLTRIGPVLNECKRLWLLKNSIFVKIAGYLADRNVCQNGDPRL
jgi:hypothetical protein